MRWRHWLQQTGESCYVCFGYFTTITRFRRLPQKAVAEARVMPSIFRQEDSSGSDYESWQLLPQRRLPLKRLRSLQTFRDFR